jgi:hypothetical protein
MLRGEKDGGGVDETGLTEGLCEGVEIRTTSWCANVCYIPRRRLRFPIVVPSDDDVGFSEKRNQLDTGFCVISRGFRR